MNRVDIFFETCTPAPSRGYKLWWRVAGSSDSYTNGGNFFISPATFFDNDNPEGTEYEGFLISDCSGVTGVSIPWSTVEGSGESGGSGGGPGVLFNVLVTIENCAETLPLLITGIKFNGITAASSPPGGYPISVGEAITLLILNYAAAGTLEIYFANNTSGGNVRIDVIDSSGIAFCSSGIGANLTTFSTFDMLPDGIVPATINISCGECP